MAVKESRISWVGKPENSENRFSRLRKSATKYACAAAIGTLGLLALDETHITTKKAGIELEVETVLSKDGGTTLDTPVGDVILPTHRGPFGLDLRVREIPVKEAMNLFKDAKRLEQLSEDLQEDLKTIEKGVKNHVARDLSIFVLGNLAGLLIGEKLTKPEQMRWKSLSKNLAAALITAGSLSIVAFGNYDIEAFKNPKLTGGVAYVQSQSDLLQIFDKHDKNIAKTVQDFLQLSEALQQLDTNQKKPSACLMVVSDIHSRNVFPLLKSIIETNCVDAIVDAGDITEWGLSIENEWRDLEGGIKGLDVPYLVVKGNHDSDQAMKNLDSVPNVTVLNGQIKKIKGLRITGLGDPSYTPDNLINGETPKEEKNQFEFQKRLEELIKRHSPDITVVHNPNKIKKNLEGTDIVISGHLHNCEPHVQKLKSGTIHYNQGSTGGAFLRIFDSSSRKCESNGSTSEEHPQNLSILYFDDQKRLYSADELTVTSLNGKLYIEFSRRTIPE